MTKRKHKVLSLFANIGVAEAYLNEIGISVPVANELVKRRAELYQKIYPECAMICGDINSDIIYADIISKSKKAGVDVILATPPCQGMSTVGQQEEDDERNSLVLPVINAIKDLKPRYVAIENVPNFVNTSILLDGEWVLLIDIIKKELEMNYSISVHIINTANYGVPQSRERMIILMTRRDLKKEWKMPLAGSLQ